MEADIKTLSLGANSFSAVTELGMWFAVAGLYQRDTLVISGEKTLSRPKGLKFWEHTQAPYFVHTVKISKQSLSSARNLRLPAAVIEKLDAGSEEQKKAQARQVSEIFSTPTPKWLFTCPVRPTRSAVTSEFGSPRTLPSGRSYYHSGVDLRAAIGNKVRAVSQGLVRFAGPMILPGNNVILDHGLGLFSRYMHLSEIHVSEGIQIGRNDLVGLAGASGRVEAPHLHWEMIWKGEHADPLAMLEAWQPVCDVTQNI